MKKIFSCFGLSVVLGMLMFSNARAEEAKESSGEILSVLVKGEQLQSSLFKTGKGSMLFEVSAEQRKEDGTLETKKQCFNVNSVFDGSKIRLEKKRVPRSNEKSIDRLAPAIEWISTDGNNIKFYYPDRKILEVGLINKAYKREISRSLPLDYGKSFVYLYPSYKVVGKVTVDNSACYIVEGIRKTTINGKNYQTRAEAIIDPNCGYLTRSLKCFVKSDDQKEILVSEYITVPKEYANGIWAPYESTETSYDATNPNDAENTKYIAEKISMKIIEYSFNIPLNQEDLEINVPKGTIIHDLSSDSIIAPEK